MAEAAGPDDDRGRARVEQRQRLAHRVVRRDAGVGQRGDVLRLGRRVELHAGARRGEQVLRHPAVGAVQPREDALGAVHVLAGSAGAAQAAGRRRVQDHRVPDGHVGHRRADLVHPAGVLVTDRVGQRRVHRLVPLAQDDVQVGAAHAGSPDLHHHVERTLDARLRRPRRWWASRCTRATALPSWRLLQLALAAGGVAVGQHAAAHAAVRLGVDPGQPGPSQVQRQRLDADRLPRRRVDQQRRRRRSPAAPAPRGGRAAGPGRPTEVRRPASCSREVVHGPPARRGADGRPGPSRPARPCGRSRSGARPARRRPGRRRTRRTRPGPRSRC